MDEFVGRKFKLWDYSVSHSRLLIRSPRNTSLSLDHNVDIIFIDVDHIDMETFLGKIYGVEVVEKVDKYHQRYRIESEHGQFHIVALNCFVHKTYMDIFESILDRF